MLVTVDRQAYTFTSININSKHINMEACLDALIFSHLTGNSRAGKMSQQFSHASVSLTNSVTMGMHHAKISYDS